MKIKIPLTLRRSKLGNEIYDALRKDFRSTEAQYLDLCIDTLIYIF